MNVGKFSLPAVNSNCLEKHVIAEWQNQAAKIAALAKGTHDNCLKISHYYKKISY